MDRIPVQGTAIFAGVASVALAGVTIYFWKVTQDKVRELESARKNVMGTLDRLRQKGSTVGDDLRDVQNSLVSWSAKCEQFQEEAAESIEQIKRDLHQQLMQAQREFASEGEEEETEGSIEGSSQHGENEYDMEEFGENRQAPFLGLNQDRILAEVQNNVAKNTTAADKTVSFSKDVIQTSDVKEAGKKPSSLAQQQLLKIQDHVNQATAFLNVPAEVLGN